MRLTKFNPETGQYEYIEPAKTQEEFIAQRKAAIQRLGEFEDRAEWISVEDRLPELEDGRNWGNHRPRSIRVLCVCQQRRGKTFVKEGYYELFSNKPCWRIPGSIDSVTHWMPLPQPPKMKGENDEQR